MKVSAHFQRTVLANGLRILTAPMPHAHSVSVSLYVGTGSRYERDEEAGVSHFLEHLLFKGTEHRPSAREIAEAVDSVGGVINGGTDREFTVYYVKVASHHLTLALDILVDLVRRPLLDPAEMEKERNVILEELAMAADSPSQLADLLLDATLWPGQPLGRDVAGTPESVSCISREMALDYLRRQYVPNNMVIAVAGNVAPEEVTGVLEPLLGDWEPGTPSPWYPAMDGRGPLCSLRYKSTEQAYLSLAVRGLPLEHPDRYALALLSALLGEGMSSRLFQELRERRGLVYEIHSYVSHFLDTGAFAVFAGVDPKNAPQALEIILSELCSLRDRGPSQAELVRAKELAKGRLLLRMEDTRNVAGWIGAQELLLGRVRGLEEVVAEMEAVTLEDLGRVARELIRGDQLYLAVVGPYRSEKQFAARLKL